MARINNRLVRFKRNALQIFYTATGGFPMQYALDSDPRLFAWGGTNAEENSLLARTDDNTLWRKSGPLSTDWLVLSGGAFGNDYQTAISTPRTTTTSPAFQTKVTLVTPALTGLFRIGWKAEVDNTNTLNDVRLQNLTDGTTVNGTQSVQNPDAAARIFVGGFAEVTFTGASKSFSLQWRDRPPGGDTQGIANARIELWKIR